MRRHPDQRLVLSYGSEGWRLSERATAWWRRSTGTQPQWKAKGGAAGASPRHEVDDLHRFFVETNEEWDWDYEEWYGTPPSESVGPDLFADVRPTRGVRAGRPTTPAMLAVQVERRQRRCELVAAAERLYPEAVARLGPDSTERDRCVEVAAWIEDEFGVEDLALHTVYDYVHRPNRSG